MKTYTTIQGDEWDKISYRIYGSEYFMTKLMDANPEYIDTAVFSSGVILKVPEVEAPLPSALPPWKRT